MKLRELCEIISNNTDVCINMANTYECLYCDTRYTVRTVQCNSLNECLSKYGDCQIVEVYNDFMEDTHGGIMGYLAIDILEL